MANIEAGIAAYLKVKAAIEALSAKHEAEMKPLSDTQSRIAAMLLDMLNRSGQSSAKTDSGTAYKSEILNVKVADPEAFTDLVFAGEIQLAKLTPIKDAVKEYMAEHGGAVPAGLATETIVRLNVRRT